jgi:23S rRNA G2069 N7-methylase RlmK/C1962 C5-methylase RlmI
MMASKTKTVKTKVTLIRDRRPEGREELDSDRLFRVTNRDTDEVLGWVSERYRDTVRVRLLGRTVTGKAVEPGKTRAQTVAEVRKAS